MSQPFPVPPGLAESCHGDDQRTAWLDQLPSLVQALVERWSLALEPAFLDDAGSCAWVAPARMANGLDVVLKVGMPHMEAADEIAGLRFWNGEHTVRLIDADESAGAMLLERCRPGTSLRSATDAEQDAVLGELLPRLWGTPLGDFRFRPLREMLDHWARETTETIHRERNPGLARAGLDLFKELSEPKPSDVVLFTDLHAGNVLRAERAPWLAIDPKPFVGDRAYDATQHLLNGLGRMQTAPLATIASFSACLGLPADRVRLWMFARCAAEPGRGDPGSPWRTVARAIAP